MFSHPVFNVAQHTLRDVRDNNNYTVKKLADGNCWMTENLKLALSAGTTVLASRDDGTTFSFTPNSCIDYGNCPLNGNVFSHGGSWFYTWYAANARNDATDVSASHSSICPSGWRLPGNYNGLLTSAYGLGNNATDAPKILLAPLNFTMNSFALGGGVRSDALYYGSGQNDATNSVNLWTDGASYLHAIAGGAKSYGGRVRCISI